MASGQEIGLSRIQQFLQLCVTRLSDVFVFHVCLMYDFNDKYYSCNFTL